MNQYMKVSHIRCCSLIIDQINMGRSSSSSNNESEDEGGLFCVPDLCSSFNCATASGGGGWAVKVRSKKPAGPKVDKMLTLPRDYKEWLLGLKERVEETEVERLMKEVGLWEKIKEVVDSNQGLLVSRVVDVGPGVKDRRILPWGRVQS